MQCFLKTVTRSLYIPLLFACFISQSAFGSPSFYWREFTPEEGETWQLDEEGQLDFFVDFGESFVSVDQVIIHLVFEDDLFDVGEEVGTYFPFEHGFMGLIESRTPEGEIGNSSPYESSFYATPQSWGYPCEALVDGQSDFYLSGESGSVGISSVDIGMWATVPEPGTVALFGLGLATLLFKNRRRLAEGLPNRR